MLMNSLKATQIFLGFNVIFLLEFSDMGDRTLVTMLYIIIKKIRTFFFYLVGN